MMSRRTGRSVYRAVVALMVLWTVWPILSVLLAELVASASGARLDEGSAHPCIIGGHDYGPLLYRMWVMGWFMLLTLPTGAIALLVFFPLTASLRHELWAEDER